MLLKPGRVLQFGTPERGREYVVRPGAYAVILDEAGRVGVVRTGTGYYLPGGGIDDDESPQVGLARELREECGRGIIIGRLIGRAIENVHAVGEGFFAKHCHFFCASLTDEPARPEEADHELLFLSPPRAHAVLRHGSQRWAVDAAIREAGTKSCVEELLPIPGEKSD